MDDGKAVSFRVEQMISLRDIFYEVPDSIEKRAVAVEFEYCDAAGVWTFRFKRTHTVHPLNCRRKCR